MTYHTHSMRTLSYSTLFTDDNYHIWKQWFQDQIISERGINLNRIVLIVDISCQQNEQTLKQWASKVYYIQDNLINLYQDDIYSNILKSGLLKLANSESNQLFLIAAGPFANIFVHLLLSSNPNNQYIDVGSSIGEFTRLYQTRPYYQDPHQVYSQLTCPAWSFPVKPKSYVSYAKEYNEWPCVKNHQGWLPERWSVEYKVDYGIYNISGCNGG